MENATIKIISFSDNDVIATSGPIVLPTTSNAVIWLNQASIRYYNNVSNTDTNLYTNDSVDVWHAYNGNTMSFGSFPQQTTQYTAVETQYYAHGTQPSEGVFTVNSEESYNILSQWLQDYNKRQTQ